MMQKVNKFYRIFISKSN